MMTGAPQTYPVDMKGSATPCFIAKQNCGILMSKCWACPSCSGHHLVGFGRQGKQAKARQEELDLDAFCCFASQDPPFSPYSHAPRHHTRTFHTQAPGSHHVLHRGRMDGGVQENQSIRNQPKKLIRVSAATGQHGAKYRQARLPLGHDGAKSPTIRHVRVGRRQGGREGGGEGAG